MGSVAMRKGRNVAIDGCEGIGTSVYCETKQSDEKRDDYDG
jgi:hypothetical protein